MIFTHVDPIFAVKFLYCLPYISQYLPSFRYREIRVILYQVKKGVSEIGVDKHAFLFVGVNVQTKAPRACKFGCELLRKVEDFPVHLFENMTFIPAPK